MARILLAVVAALAAVPATAQAAIVEERQPPCSPSASKYGPCDPANLVVEAAPGERNDVTVASAPDATRVRDAVAPLRAGPGCRSVDEHEVVCGAGRSVVVRLGDGDDRLVLESTLPPREPGGAFLPSLVGDGGPGDDVLTGSRYADTLDGGIGRDVLAGGDDNDVLSGGPGGVGDGGDSVDGGPGLDRVDFSGRADPVVVDLATGAGGGLGEGDRIATVEHVVGTRAADRLSGTDGPDALTGMGGTDRLEGRDGDDRLEIAYDVPAVVLGGAGDDVVRTGIDGPRAMPPERGPRILCGPGRDAVDTAAFPIVIRADCERAGEGGPYVHLRLPLASPRSVFATFAIPPPCPECSTTRGLKVRAARGPYRGRLVAGGRREARLNALGRRLLARTGPLWVDVRVFGTWLRIAL